MVVVVFVVVVKLSPGAAATRLQLSPQYLLGVLLWRVRKLQLEPQYLGRLQKRHVLMWMREVQLAPQDLLEMWFQKILNLQLAPQYVRLLSEVLTLQLTPQTENRWQMEQAWAATFSTTRLNYIWHASRVDAPATPSRPREM